MSDRICVVEGCEYAHHARGYCTGHAQRFRRHGDPRAELPLQRPRGEYDWRRAFQKPNGEDGCWPWRTVRRGYAVIIVAGVQFQAHRFVYEQLVGPIPAGHVLDHLCHNADESCSDDLSCMHRKCVNPAHLEPVTHGENVRRGHGVAGVNARKTHCKRGHPFAGANVQHTIINGRPARRCLACQKVNSRARYLRAKARATN